MCDFHIHSSFSMDCEYLVEEMVGAGIDKRLKMICFTDHIEYDTGQNKIDIDFKHKDYFQKINQVKYIYKHDIEVLAGLEIGIQPYLANRYNVLIDNNPCDFIIMSVHSIGDVDRECVYLESFVKDKTPIDSILEYYEHMYRCILSYDNFDVVGHLDYVDRFFSKPNTVPEFHEYSYMVEKVLKLIISKGKGIELNTSGRRYSLDYYHPKTEILCLYRDLGGEIITIGSDAHRPEDIGHDYQQVKALLKTLGFRDIYIFKERKGHKISLLG